MRRYAAMLAVTVMFPLLWTLSRTESWEDPVDGPLRLSDLWACYKRLWRGDQ